MTDAASLQVVDNVAPLAYRSGGEGEALYSRRLVGTNGKTAGGAVEDVGLEVGTEGWAASCGFQLELVACSIDAVDVLGIVLLGLPHEAIVLSSHGGASALRDGAATLELDGLAVQVIGCAPVVAWQGNDIGGVCLHCCGEREVYFSYFIAGKLFQPELLAGV